MPRPHPGEREPTPADSSLSLDHPFIDGNKRTAYVAIELFLQLNGFVLGAPDAECVLLMLGVAAGDISEAELAQWLRDRITHA